jgi:hypothetical protein
MVFRRLQQVILQYKLRMSDSWPPIHSICYGHRPVLSTDLGHLPWHLSQLRVAYFHLSHIFPQLQARTSISLDTESTQSSRFPLF